VQVANDPLLIVAAERPFPGEPVNGDAWCTTWHAGRCRIALIDGLGHGPEAAQAAQAAVATLNQRPELSPADALAACHGALAGSRGAAISIVQIDPSARQLTYAGIGNVEGRLNTANGTTRLIAYRGIIGSARHQVRSFDYALDRSWSLLLHTDGISSRMEITEPMASDASALRAQADSLLERWARPTDDATLLLVVPRHDE